MEIILLEKAIKKGAGCVVTSSKVKNYSDKIIKVKNSISFLNNFAKFKRDLSSATIIAVTGSAGKTSLKNLINDLLKNWGKTYSSPKSFNNYLGVPVSMSNLSVNDKFGVFEVGMSRMGEIRNLTKIIKPQVGIITNIGEAHLENFNSIHGIAKAKSEIIEHIQPDGHIVLNRDDRFLTFLFKKAKAYNLNITTFGFHKMSDVRVTKITNKDKSPKIFVSINNQKIQLEIKDLNIYNVLASIAVLKHLKILNTKIINKLKILSSPEGRGKNILLTDIRKKFRLIDESYNANPLSVKNAIKKLNSIKKENFKKYLILGDMLELGPKSKKYHKDLSKVINSSDIDKVFVKGKKQFSLINI